MKRRFLALVLAGCLAAVLSTAAWATLPTGFYLNVELPSGETIALDAESGDSIENLKQKLETETSIAAEEQHLYYGGKLLVDDLTLSNYNIQKGSTLLLTTKSKGTPSGKRLTEENMSGGTIGAPVIINEKTLNSGTHYLCNDVELKQALVIQGDVTLDLNGFVLQYENSDANDSVIRVEGGTLTLVDSHPDAVHKFKTDETTGLWTLDESQGTEVIKGGVITGGNAGTDSYGGGVCVYPSAGFVMQGGNIVGCKAKQGGGVYVADDYTTKTLGHFTMEGGSIIGCVATDTSGGGGGVCSLGDFTMTGGTIRSCTATNGGGGGICSVRQLYISGNAVVRDCKAGQSYNYSNAMLLYLSSHNYRAVIEGGIFSGSVNVDVEGHNSQVSITGGTFDPAPYGITLHTVTFNSNGGSDVPGQIRANAAATKPADPTRSGYVFKGWYTDEACTAAYDFTKNVAENVTLYAKWAEAPRYYYYGGTTAADEGEKGSPKTFDAGVGVYAASAALSLTGTAWIGRKRH